MERNLKLPEEYSNSGELNLDDVALEGNDLNLQNIDSTLNLDDSNVYKMIGEDEQAVSSNVVDVNNAQVKSLEPMQTDAPVMVETSVEQSPQSNQNSLMESEGVRTDANASNDSVAKSVEELDRKIANLQTILDNIAKENNIDDVNQFLNENNNEINLSNNNAQSSNITNDVKNIINEINSLKNIKREYENSMVNKNTTLENIENTNVDNSLLQDSANVLFDNFTPNLRIDPSDPNFDPENPKPWKKQQATEKAIQTEKTMGGDPVVEVVPGIGEVVIDKNTQSSATEAVKQHGGWENAMTDAVNNQNNYYDSTSSTESEPQYNNESTSFVQNESFDSNNTENLTENLPDLNKDLVRGSNESIVILNKISQQLDGVIKSLGSNFNTLGKSIKNLKSDQKNYSYNNTNNSAPDNNNLNTSNNDSKPNNIQEIRGDNPLAEDFPKDFKLDSLFSNLRS